MNFSRKIQGVIAGGAIIFIGLIETWPLPFEPNILNSLKIYSNYVFGGQVRVSDLLGSVDIACAVGPYDSFRDKRFSKILSEEQIVAADNALYKMNLNHGGYRQFLMVGLRGTTVSEVYASNLFKNLKSLDKIKSTRLDCVGGDGFVSPEEFGTIIAIELNQGV
jgi:hypothetical protein